MSRALCVFILSLGILTNISYAADTIRFGIVPQQSAKKLARLWTPINAYLSKQSGLSIQFTTANDIPTFEQRVLKGEYDLAYMNPYHYTVFSQKPGYRAIIKQKDKRIKGILVAPKDSPITSLESLNDSTLSFPSPAAFAASVLPRAKLAADGINITPKYVSSHDSVYLTVSKGLFPAGGGVMRTFNNTDAEVRETLKVLWTTPGYTPHAIAVHPRMDADVVSKLQTAFMTMNNNDEGRQLLESINFKGMEMAKDSDWDDVRALNITLLDYLLED